MSYEAALIMENTMKLDRTTKPTGICKGCKESTHIGDHSECYLLIENPVNHKPAKSIQKNYKTGKLPSFMYD